jgi:hypothetical protein
MEQNTLLDTVYVHKPTLEYEVDALRIVTVLVRQNHWIQRLARKLRFGIPAYRRIALDEYASFVFLCIDGKRTVRTIGECLTERFALQANPLYERLGLFLEHIERNEHFIVRTTLAD